MHILKESITEIDGIRNGKDTTIINMNHLYYSVHTTGKHQLVFINSHLLNGLDKLKNDKYTYTFVEH